MAKQEKKLSPWISGTQKPVRVGVYARQYSDGEWFSKWDGERWIVAHSTIDGAALRYAKSLFQEQKWRGLASRPR